MTQARHLTVHDLDGGARDAFVARGHAARHYFPHRAVRLRKGGPDGLKLSRRMCDPATGPGDLWEVVLYALPPVLDEFPRDLFFDDDIVWHQQQFGLDGQVATATITARGHDLYVLNMLADVVQRIGRRRDLKTRVENRFKGWPILLVNAVLALAIDHGFARVLVADPDWVLAHTDPTRAVQRPLFERVYDGGIRPPFRAVHEGNWWVLDVAANAATVLPPTVRVLPRPAGRRICVHHDVERGWGHLVEDPAFAATADALAPEHLDRMLTAEAAADVRATYSVVGFLVPELGDRIRAAGHALAFHSFDHAGPDEPDAARQLGRCRAVDYRLKGYRPAQSRLTPELSDENLSFHNFEWLASSRHSLGTDRPELRNGVVRVPILFDDFDLHRGADYSEWLDRALRTIEAHDAAVFSTHDCYGPHWIDHYPELLRRLQDLGSLCTVDGLAAEVLLADAR